MKSLGICALALTVRLAYVHETKDQPTLRYLVGDAAGYYQWAERIAAGDWWGSESFYQAPLYPYVLASWMHVAGDEVWLIRCFQSGLGALAVYFLSVGARDFIGPRAALVAAGILAFYPPAIFFDGILQKAALDGVLVCAIIAVLGQVCRSARLTWSLTMGVILGLLALTRENAIVWAPVLMLWICWKAAGEEEAGLRRWMRKPSAFVFGVALVLVPVGLRNLAVGGEWSVSTFQAGPNFYIGNHRGAPGYYRPLVQGQETPFHERADAMRLAQEAAGRELTANEASRFWMRRTWAEIAEAPGAWAQLMGRKFLLLINRYEISDVESYYVYRESSFILSALRFLHWGTILPLAILGVGFTFSEWRRLWLFHVLIGTMALAITAFYVMARYRYPLVPLLIPFAAAAVVQFYDWVSQRDARNLTKALCLLVIVAVPVNWPLLDEHRLNGLALMNVGVALAQKGEITEATDYFRAAVQRHAGSAEARNNLAQALAMQGQYPEAVVHYQAALQLAERPEVATGRALPGVWYNLGVALENLGRLNEALAAYGQAVAADPGDEDAQGAMTRLTAKLTP